MITAVLMSWKRKPNMPLIIEALRSQTVPVVIWLVNNNGVEDFGADRTTFHNPSPGEWARYAIAGRVETEYCMFQDDDYMLGDDHFLEDALAIYAEMCPSNLLGVAGRGLQGSYPYYSPDIVDRNGYASILKGHFQLFKTEITRRARLSHLADASDIYWSLDIGDGLPAHYVSKKLSRRLDTLPRFGVGYELRPGHMAQRNEVCSAWLEERNDAPTCS